MHIAELEKIFDEKYATFNIPVQNVNLMRWYIFMVADDILINIWSSNRDFRLISVLADRLKYSLKHALIRIERELVDKEYVSLPVEVVPEVYEETGELLYAGMEYFVATKICTLVHEGISEIIEEESRIFVRENFLWKNLGYSAVEMFDLGGSSSQHFLLLRALNYLVEPKFTKFYFDLSAKANVDSKGVISYQYNHDLCKKLSEDVPFFGSMIPEGWVFPWGSGDQVNKLLWALNVRCLFHLFTIRTTAAVHNISGGGHESLCLIAERSVLAAELSDLSRVEVRICENFIKALTIGAATRTADPALQPFIEIDETKVAIGCVNLLTCRQDRNMLSLHARVDQRLFDRQSKMFEIRMVDELSKAAASRKLQHRCNINIPGEKSAGDVDLLFFDIRAKELLVCELRWMIQPGDPREIVNRAKACEEKVGKVGVKVAAVRRKLVEVAKVHFGTEIFPEEWKVNGIIVVDGYGGIESSNSEFPIMHKKIFMEGLKYFSKIDQIYIWAKSLKWLPQKNIHYSQETISSAGASTKMIERNGLSLIGPTDIYIDYVKKSIKIAK